MLWAALMVGAGVAADRGRARHGAEDDGRCPQPGEHASQPRNARAGRNSAGKLVLLLRQNRGALASVGYPQQDLQKFGLRSEHVGRKFALKISRNRRSSNPTLRSVLLLGAPLLVPLEAVRMELAVPLSREVDFHIPDRKFDLRGFTPFIAISCHA
jgi:hypothetical protein